MDRNGFTVTEISLVLVLAALVMLIAGPALTSSLGRATVRTSVDEFTSAHALARSLAIQHNGRGEVHIDATSARFWVEVYPQNDAASDTVGGIRQLSDKGVTLSSDRSRLCFDGRGLPTTRGGCEVANATIVFSAGAKVDTITITALGRVMP